MGSDTGYSIEARSVFKSFGHTRALADACIHFSAGHMHGVIGPEGAGKTTLFRILLQLLHPDEGNVLYRQIGRDLDFADIREHLAYMPQTQSLYPDLSISEHLDFFRDLYGIPDETYRERRTELLRITRLEPFQDRPAGKLSGGMYKKLGLMCALLRSPKILLLDEPTNGVDPISRREFWELLNHFLSRGLLIILSTAYMDEAERCSEVHLMEAGKVLISGEPKKILQENSAASIQDLFLKLHQPWGHA